MTKDWSPFRWRLNWRAAATLVESEYSDKLPSSSLSAEINWGQRSSKEYTILNHCTWQWLIRCQRWVRVASETRTKILAESVIIIENMYLFVARTLNYMACCLAHRPDSVPAVSAANRRWRRQQNYDPWHHDDDEDDWGFAESWRFACAACGEFGQNSDRLINGDRDLLGPARSCVRSLSTDRSTAVRSS